MAPKDVEANDKFELWQDLDYAPGIDEDERQDVIAAVIEAYGLQDFQTGGFDRYRSAPRILAVICGADHPHSQAGGPELAFVYATAHGPLFTARVVDAFEGVDSPLAQGLRHSRDELLENPGLVPVRAHQYSYLLHRSSPAVLPIQCRRHGSRMIPRDQLAQAVDLLLGGDTRTPRSIPSTWFAKT